MRARTIEFFKPCGNGFFKTQVMVKTDRELVRTRFCRLSV